MRTLLLLVATMISGTTFADTLTCGDVKMLEFDDNGAGTLVPADVQFDIAPSAAGQYGFEGTITSGGQTQKDTDVQLTTETSVSPDIQELGTLLIPGIVWTDVKEVRVGNIGVEANLQDSGGIIIFDFLDVNGNTLGKVVKIGWGFAKCGK